MALTQGQPVDLLALLLHATSDPQGLAAQLKDETAALVQAMKDHAASKADADEYVARVKQQADAANDEAATRLANAQAHETAAQEHETVTLATRTDLAARVASAEAQEQKAREREAAATEREAQAAAAIGTAEARRRELNNLIAEQNQALADLKTKSAAVDALRNDVERREAAVTAAEQELAPLRDAAKRLAGQGG